MVKYSSLSTGNECGDGLIREQFKLNLFKYYLWKNTDLDKETTHNMFVIYNNITWDCYNLYGHMNEKNTIEYDEVIQSIELINECSMFRFLWK